MASALTTKRPPDGLGFLRHAEQDRVFLFFIACDHRRAALLQGLMMPICSRKGGGDFIVNRLAETTRSGLHLIGNRGWVLETRA